MASYRRLKTSDDFVKPEPELKLWRAVLSLAADDAVTNKVRCCNGWSDIDIARSWFTQPSSNFYLVCNYAGYEPSYVHDKMIKSIKKVEEKERYEKNM